MKPVCAANWKLNKTPREALEFFAEFSEQIDAIDARQFVFFPPALSLYAAVSAYADQGYGFGAQNIYQKESGAFTGENSVLALRDMDCKFVLVGHSERRSLFAETDKDCAEKVKLAVASGLIPVLCVGETLQQRESGETFDVIRTQLSSGLAQLKSGDQFWVAYEPVWAIGTGRVATPGQAEDCHLFIRRTLSEIFDQTHSEITPILYGGSVKADNAKDLYQGPNINGFLIGGASLEPRSLAEIYQNCL